MAPLVVLFTFVVCPSADVVRFTFVVCPSADYNDDLGTLHGGSGGIG